MIKPGWGNFGPKKIKPEPAMLVSEIQEWRTLREFPDYQISNDGRLRRLTAGSNTKAGALIRTVNGTYPHYGLTLPGGKRVHRNAHQLVAAEFLDPKPFPDALVLHDDDNRLNCRDSNLKWGDGKSNVVDAKRNGKWEVGAQHSSTRKPWCKPRGIAHPHAKLNEDQVLLIMTDQRPIARIAEAYGVDSALIPRIKQGKIWKHVTNPEYNAMLEAGKRNDTPTT